MSSSSTQISGTRTALVTGASAGIGLAFTRELVAHGWKVLAVARRQDRLVSLSEELGRERCIPIPTDLRDEGARRRLIEQVGPELDLLVNNAGFGDVGNFAERNYPFQREMVEVNCIAPLHLTHGLLPILSKRRGGIINVCSMCSFQPMPIMATYGATKAFLFSLTHALAAEQPQVRYLALCPGPVPTEFHLVAGLSKKIDVIPGLPPEEVVRLAMRAFERGSRTLVPGAMNKLLTAVGRHLPARVSAAVVRFMLRGYAEPAL